MTAVLNVTKIGEATAEPVPVAPLVWEAGPSRDEPRVRTTMGDFIRFLRDADIIDFDVETAPGGFLVLPWGVRILERFRAAARDSAVAAGFESFEFPSLTPAALYDNMAGLIERSALVTATCGAGAGHVLTPTGEQAIYNYWSRHLRHKTDFPARLCQQARYFRAATSHRLAGGGPYKSVEASDVFEFHAAHLDRGAAEEEARRMAGIFAELADLVEADFVVGRRPSWSNLSQLYDWAIGFDAPLPNGTTVQIASAYHQAQVFSQRYNVGVGSRERRQHAWIADGAISRRLVFAALHQRFGGSGSWSLPVALAPVELVVIATASDLERVSDLSGHLATLCRVRPGVAVRVVAERQIGRERRLWARRGVPLQMLFFDGGAQPRVQLRRTFDGRELAVTLWQIGPELVDAALAECRTAYRAQRAAELGDRIVDAKTETELAEGMAAGRVVRCAMQPSAQHVARVAALGHGEVLSFADAEELAPCIYGSGPTRSRAQVSRRL